jgi:hypothetical protein
MDKFDRILQLDAILSNRKTAVDAEVKVLGRGGSQDRSMRTTSSQRWYTAMSFDIGMVCFSSWARRASGVCC